MEKVTSRNSARLATRCRCTSRTWNENVERKSIAIVIVEKVPHMPPKPKKTNEDSLGEDDVRSMMSGRVVSLDRSDSSDDENIDEDYYLSDHEMEFDGSHDRSIKCSNQKQEPQQSSMTTMQQTTTSNSPTSTSCRGRAAYLKTFKQRSHQVESFFDETFEDPIDRVSSFLDMTFWRREKICCGIVFKGPNNEIVISPKLFKPCSCRNGSVSKSTTSPSTSLPSIPKTPKGSSSSDNFSLSSSSAIFSPSRLEDDNESNDASSSNSVA